MKRITKKAIMNRSGWGALPAEVRKSRKCSPGAKTAYSTIISMIRDKAATQLVASEDGIGSEYGACGRTFRRHSLQLEKAGFVSIVRRDGKPNIYILLSFELDGQQDFFEAEATPDKVSPVEAQTPDKVSRVEAQTPDKVVHPTPDKVVRGQAGVSFKRGNPEKTEENAASNFYDTLGSLKPGKLPGELGFAAAAFLSKHFDEKTRAELFREYRPDKILHTQRVFEAKTGKIKNGPGLVRHLLETPANPREIAAAANEVLGEFRKENDPDKGRHREAKDRSSIHDWVEKQPDAEDLKKRAQKHAASFEKAADFQTIRKLVNGYLWKIRKQRERQKQRFGTEVAEA